MWYAIHGIVSADKWYLKRNDRPGGVSDVSHLLGRRETSPIDQSVRKCAEP